MNENNDNDNYSYSSLLKVLQNTIAKDAVDPRAEQIDNYQTRDTFKKPLNRRERRLQAKRMKTIDRQLNKVIERAEQAENRKAVDLTAEERLRVQRTLLARLKEENAKFAAMEERKETENE